MPGMTYATDDGVPRIERFWDEKCASCRVANEDCPFIMAIISMEIFTYDGAHIMECGQYDPDMESPLYVEPGNQLPIRDLNEMVENLQAKLDRIRNMFGENADAI